MAIPVDMIYDDDTTRKSATAYIICMYVYVLYLYVCIYYYYFYYTVLWRSSWILSTEKRFHQWSAFIIIYNIRKPF